MTQGRYEWSYITDLRHEEAVTIFRNPKYGLYLLHNTNARLKWAVAGSLNASGTFSNLLSCFRLILWRIDFHWICCIGFSHTIANIISHNLIEILQQATSTSSTIRTEIEDTAQQVLEQMKSPKDTEEYDLPGHDLFDKKTEADNLRVLMQKSLGKTIENFLRQDLQ